VRDGAGDAVGDAAGDGTWSRLARSRSRVRGCAVAAAACACGLCVCAYGWASFRMGSRSLARSRSLTASRLLALTLSLTLSLSLSLSRALSRARARSRALDVSAEEHRATRRLVASLDGDGDGFISTADLQVTRAYVPHVTHASRTRDARVAITRVTRCAHQPLRKWGERRATRRRSLTCVSCPLACTLCDLGLSRSLLLSRLLSLALARSLSLSRPLACSLARSLARSRARALARPSVRPPWPRPRRRRWCPS
jgi:hypothetical protein